MANIVTSKPHITELIWDINKLLTSGKYGESGLASLSARFEGMFRSRLAETRELVEKSSVRMSNFGTTCERKLWYSVNEPEQAQPLLGHTRMKFLYGDILEQLVLSLAEEAGHEVTGQQDEVEFEGVVGHRDAVIDGVVIDVKSANGRSFQKYRKTPEEIRDDIWFQPYYTQLQLYLAGGQNDPLVSNKNTAAFLAIDQEMGHLHLSLVPKQKKNWAEEVQKKRKMLGEKDPPPRRFQDEVDGMSGNRKLCTYCSYCQYNKQCWPGLRTFISSQGPKHLTVVKRVPSMIEKT